MRHPRITIFLTACLVLFSACTRPADDTVAKSTTPPVATVNGKPITSEFFDQFLNAATGQPADKVPAEQKAQLLDQLLFELRMRFVEVKQAAASSDPAPRIILP